MAAVFQPNFVMSRKSISPEAVALIEAELKSDLTNFKTFYSQFCKIHTALNGVDPDYTGWYAHQQWNMGLRSDARALPNVMKTAANVYSRFKAEACAGPGKAACCTSDLYLGMNAHCQVTGLPNLDVSNLTGTLQSRRLRLSESTRRNMAQRDCATALSVPWKPRHRGGSGGSGGGGMGRTAPATALEEEISALRLMLPEAPDGLDELRASLPAAPTGVPEPAPVPARKRAVAILK